jgi:hypothetical protein
MIRDTSIQRPVPIVENLLFFSQEELLMIIIEVNDNY